MSFYKKIKEDAKRQKKEIMDEAQGYYHAASFEQYGASRKRYFSFGRVLTYAACLVLILAVGLTWGLLGGKGNYSLSPDAMEDFSAATGERYTAHSLIYEGEEVNEGLYTEFDGDYKVESGGKPKETGTYLKKQEGVVLSDLSPFGGQSVTISYKVFVNENGAEMYYLFALSSQQARLEIITFIAESYSAAKYKNESQKITMAGKTIYLKSAQINGETQYQVFYTSGGKGVYLVLTAPQEGAYSLLESVLSSLAD